MDAGIISNRYAKAIFQYALERKEENRLREELKILSEQFLMAPTLKMVLDDPTVSSTMKIDVLTTAAGKEISNTCKQVIRMIVKNGRARYMQSIALMYDKVYRKAKNRVILKLITTEPVSDEMKKELVDLIKRDDAQVDFDAKTDSDVIGGFILEIEDLRLDASIRNQLNQLRLELIHPL
ncbi:MAG: F0F1 ATP synthase subunit delta [Candidatus Azobacteroides sp.]|nr:F0F1 ATP synthase subunit delta [Candidatus Azobacteroides sp.]